MGYLTTITCYNDGKDELLQHSEAFAEQICDVMENRFTRYFPITLPLGNFVNFAKIHQPRHSSEQAVYVLCGNTVCDMSSNSIETRELMERNPKHFESLLEILRKNYEALQQEYKNLK
jgi:hypothetical protein